MQKLKQHICETCTCRHQGVILVHEIHLIKAKDWLGEDLPVGGKTLEQKKRMVHIAYLSFHLFQQEWWSSNVLSKPLYIPSSKKNSIGATRQIQNWDAAIKCSWSTTSSRPLATQSGKPVITTLLTPGDTSFTLGKNTAGTSKRGMSNHQGARSQQIHDGLVAVLHPFTVTSLASDCQVGTTLVFHVGDILACDVPTKKRPA